MSELPVTLPVTLYNKYQVFNMVITLFEIYSNKSQVKQIKQFQKEYSGFAVSNVYNDNDLKYIKLTFEYHPFKDDKNGYYQVIYSFDHMPIEYEIYFVHTDKTGYTNHSLAEHGILL